MHLKNAAVAAVMTVLSICLISGGEIYSAEGNPVVKEILVVGNKYVKSSDIKYRMRTRINKPLDRKVLDEDFKRLWKMGNFSDVQIHEEKAGGGIRLRVVVKEKSLIRRVAFRGNKQVNTKSLKKLISSDVGQNYDPGIANRDVRAIEDWYKNEYYYFTKVEAKTESFEDGVRLVFAIDEGGRVSITDVIFHGNNSIDSKDLQKHMATQPSGFFNRGKYDRKVFEQDLERLRIYYQSKGFLDVSIKERPFRITSKQAKSKWRQQKIFINIDINEGEKYQVGKITFNVTPENKSAVYNDNQLREVIKTLPGEVYSPIVAAKDAMRIRDLYGEKGRIFTMVKPERVLSAEGTVVDVNFNIKESKKIVLEDVVITGLVKTKEKVVRREVEVYPGEVFDSGKMDDTVKNLNRLNFFERPVNWDVKEGSGEDRAKVVIDLKEKSTGQLSFGVGMSSADGVVGSVSVKQRNFDRSDHPKSLKDLLSGKAYTGAGEYFSASISAGGSSKNASIDYVDPWVFNRPLRFGTGMFYSEREWSSHDEGRVGAYFLLGQQVFGKNWDLSGRYKIENVNISDVHSSVSQDLRDEEGDNWISRVELRLTYDTRDDIFTPTEGWYAFGAQELAGGPLAGSKDFWRSKVETNYFWTFWKDGKERPHVVSFRGELGVADAYGDDKKVPLYERYYAGGIGSLRGFDYHSLSPLSMSGDPIGGENVTTGSVEYFFPIFSKVIRGSFFYDIGGVRESANDWTGETRTSTGAGLHLKTPLGPMPVRVYYTKPLVEEEGDDTATIQFTFGALF
ncbi:MAG: outer membrane protein assembly factor BamA [Planctomycetota bacterium]